MSDSGEIVPHAPTGDTPVTLVMGVGNPLMGDEGLGPRVVEYLLTHWEFPPTVEILDAGTMGFSILNLFQGRERVIVVDAVDGTGHEPGTVLLLDADSMAPNQILHSLHDARLPDVIAAARLTGLEPQVRCVGVQIERIVQWELQLTPALETAVPLAAGAVVELLQAEGIPFSTAGATATDTAHVIEALRSKGDITG